MAIPEKCDRVSALLDRLKKYDTIVKGDNFGPEAMDDLKSNAKGIVDESKEELDQIKSEVDSW
ncbi:unnamed protein product [marine sediment metagenome]|uniref:Uncharacterized protein n=1 Tax=marine sediment metagenome TaxID=412755 RepID=X1SYN0_9ZZZZ